MRAQWALKWITNPELQSFILSGCQYPGVHSRVLCRLSTLLLLPETSFHRQCCGLPESGCKGEMGQGELSVVPSATSMTFYRISRGGGERVLTGEFGKWVLVHRKLYLFNSAGWLVQHWKAVWDGTLGLDSALERMTFTPDKLHRRTFLRTWQSMCN